MGRISEKEYKRRTKPFLQNWRGVSSQTRRWRLNNQRVYPPLHCSNHTRRKRQTVLNILHVMLGSSVTPAGFCQPFMAKHCFPQMLSNISLKLFLWFVSAKKSRLVHLYQSHVLRSLLGHKLTVNTNFAYQHGTQHQSKCNGIPTRSRCKPTAAANTLTKSPICDVRKQC